MDRFIEEAEEIVEAHIDNLKSNMDRFIDYEKLAEYITKDDLKSNMDRFIVKENDIPTNKVLI